MPIGRLLRDFRLAWSPVTRSCRPADLEQIAASGGLDAANVAFLKIRRLDAIGSRVRALDWPEVDDVLRMRLPSGVRQILLAAVHDRYLQEASVRLDTEAAVEALRERPQYLALHSGPRVVHQAQALATLLVLDRLYPTAAPHEVGPDLHDDPWLAALTGTLAPHEQAADAAQPDIAALLDEARYERRGGPSTRWRTGPFGTDSRCGAAWTSTTPSALGR